MKKHGYDVDCIIGARTKDLVILEDKIRQVVIIYILVQMMVHMDYKVMLMTVLQT